MSSALPASPPPTHNRYLDDARRVVAANPHPTPCTPEELRQAELKVSFAMDDLRALYSAVRGDDVLRIQAETAGAACRRLQAAIQARRAGQGVH